MRLFFKGDAYRIYPGRGDAALVLGNRVIASAYRGKDNRWRISGTQWVRSFPDALTCFTQFLMRSSKEV